MQSPSGRPRSRIAPAILLVLLPFAAYLPALTGGFVWDDDYNVLDKASLGGLDGLRRIWLDTQSTQQYYPLTHTVFWLEYQLWGDRPAGYHVINVLLHAASGLLIWRILRRLAVPGAWLAAAIFAVHPVHVESVAWITEHKNTLSGVLYCSSALCFLRHALRRPPSSPGIGWAAPLAVALFVAALLAKSVTSTLPVALALLLVWKLGKPRVAQFAWLGSMLVLGAAMGVLTLLLETHSVGAKGADFSLSAVERLLVATRATWFYLGKLVWPHPLAFSYARWEIDAGAAWQYLYVVAAALVGVALVAARRRIGAGALVAALYFTITLSPALGLFNVFYMRYAFVADHFQYLASIGPIALVAALAARWSPGRLAARAGSALLLVTLGALSWNQAGAYRDQETLWRRSLAAEPESFMAHYNLGEFLEREGEWDEATEHYRETLRLNPDWADGWVNLGSVLGKRGEFERALEHFDRAIEVAPTHAVAHFDRGVALEMLDRPELALLAYREAVRLQPDRIDAHNNLALLYFARGEYEAAWREVHLVRRVGGEVSATFVARLAKEMPDPGDS